MRLSSCAPWKSTSTTVLTLLRHTSLHLLNRRASLGLRPLTVQLTASRVLRASSRKRSEPNNTRRGGDGIRTHCLYIANVALYQLSYTPEGVPTLAQGVARG